ncbi:hypothetical protein IWW36_002612 [Coemansia brasiliensis]|uniref:Ubiquitin carboxyl-terminal hydrolase n=1 Tax=Coemansia brasiliensis TaxID=2650707 RepID=A0A9W8M0V0_9FUNG|nr:hypothetical protein IWW36_002612 [Coemansia brasiliensis]
MRDEFQTEAEDICDLESKFWAAQYKEYRRRKAKGHKSVEPEIPAEPAKPAKPTKPANWAALFQDRSTQSNSTKVNIVGKQAAQVEENVGVRKFTTLEDVLENWRVKLSMPKVQPRGLVNTGNMCFMNVVLQALLYCGPFYNLLQSIKDNVVFSFGTSTPLLESLIMFMHEFKQDKTGLADLETELAEPFVPENVYDALQQKNVFQTLRGQQEDAQEFMSHLVDGIHEEMATVLQARQAETERTGSAGWIEVRAKNRAGQVRSSHEATPITQIFGGTLQSALTEPAVAGRAIQRMSREPFRWLALDVSAAEVERVEDALDALVAPETIEGFVDAKGAPAAATKQTVLEHVPPVLVLHLKRFVFCADEGVKKVHKFIEYPETLALAPQWLARGAGRQRGKQYRLSGVIYHHGSDASGGHYTCDVVRAGDEWVRFDDVDISGLAGVDAALEEKKDRTAYILFYTIKETD